MRGEFGYWVFEGDWQPAQRPSWNYRKEDDGGIIVDMLCHWRYVLDNLFGEVKSVMLPRRHAHPASAGTRTASPTTRPPTTPPTRRSSSTDGVIAQINSSWCTRVRRDDLVTFHVDGTLGSAVAGLTDCRIQPRAATPKPVWNPDVPQTIDFFDDVAARPGEPRRTTTRSRSSGSSSCATSSTAGPFQWNLLEGAKGVQLAELGLQSWRERRFVDVPALAV